MRGWVVVGKHPEECGLYVAPGHRVVRRVEPSVLLQNYLSQHILLQRRVKHFNRQDRRSSIATAGSWRPQRAKQTVAQRGSTPHGLWNNFEGKYGGTNFSVSARRGSKGGVEGNASRWGRKPYPLKLGEHHVRSSLMPDEQEERTLRRKNTHFGHLPPPWSAAIPPICTAAHPTFRLDTTS